MADSRNSPKNSPQDGSPGDSESLESRLRSKLEKAFVPTQCVLENESHKHGFSRGPEGHFKLLIISDAFKGMSRVERHQKIFAVVKSEMDEGIHALAIRALTKAESLSAGLDFESPACGRRDH